MRVVNQAGTGFGLVPSRMNFPGHTLTLVAKATLKLTPGGVATLLPALSLPDGDTLYPDDAEGLGSLRTESDFAPIKPRTDLMLTGHAWAPHGGAGVPALSVHVKFSVADTSRGLLVVGDRRSKPGEPEPAATPFTSMPLVYERAFGSPRYKPNPVGTGHRAEDDETGDRIVRWPNLFDARDEIGYIPPFARVKPELPAEQSQADQAAAANTTPLPASPRVDPYSPAGFGPIRREWHSRVCKLGTYDSTWLKHLFPGPPSDFDPTYYNAASPDLQRDGFLMGGEEIRMENLHPSVADYRCRLPGLRVRAFRNDLPPPDPHAGPRVGTPHEIASRGVFTEVPLNLDTLWVDADTETAVLTWRGFTVVSDEDFEEIAHIFLMTDTVGRETTPLAECRDRFLNAIKADEAPFSPESPTSEPAAEAVLPEQPEAPSDPAVKAAIEAELAKVDAPPEVKARVLEMLTATEAHTLARMKREARESLKQAGLNPDSMPPLTPEQIARKFELLKQWGFDPDDVVAAETAAGPLSLADEPPASAPGPSPATQRANFESSLVAAGFDLRTRALAMELFDLSPEALDARLKRDLRVLYRQHGIDPDNPPRLSPQDEQKKTDLLRAWGIDPAWAAMAERAEEESRADQRVKATTLAPMTRERVLEEVKSGQSLSGARLAGLDLAGADLTGADLEGADLQRANLDGAVLAAATLARANLANASLVKADLAGVIAPAADFTAAKLDEVNATGADFAAAIFVDARLRGARLDGATADSAAFTRVDAAGMSAAAASFAGSDFTGANLRDAHLAEADLSRAALIRADLQSANLTDTRLADADATGADFSKANITNLRASGGTVLRQARFYNARGEGTKWRGCDLRAADLRYARIPGADFGKACLDDADLSASDIPGGTFRKASLRRAKFILVNLFNGSLEKADLAGADFRGSNCYGVEFLDTVAGDNLTEGVNLKMTKLAKAATT